MTLIRGKGGYHFVYFVVVFTLIPINYLPQLLDGVYIDYAFAIGDISTVNLWYGEAGRYNHRFVIILVDKLVRYTGLPAELLLDNILVVVLILFCIEVKQYASLLFGLENRWANLAALFTAIFPVWHVLADFDIGQYLISIYLLYIGFRLFVDDKIYKNILGASLVFLSFNVESNISMVVGLAIISLVLEKTNNNYTFPVSKLIIIILLASLYILVRAIYLPPHGLLESYMVINWSNLGGGSLEIVRNLFNFLTFLLLFIWLPLIYYIHLKTRNKKYLRSDGSKRLEKRHFTDAKIYFLLIVLAGFAVSPYLVIGESTSIINLTDWKSRHAFLLAPLSGIFFATMFKDIAVANCVPNKVQTRNYLIVFICVNVLLLSYGNYRKVETSLFRKNMIEQLQLFGSIPKGNVQVISENIPGAIRFMEVNHLFFSAYKVAGWWGDAVAERVQWSDVRNTYRQKFWNKIKNNDKYLSLFMLGEYIDECDIYVHLKDSMGKYERIRKLYIFRSEKYYNIDNIVIEC